GPDQERPQPHRHRRQPVQEAGLRLPVRRGLRRHPLGVGLRPARGGAEGEHQAAVVALGGHRARRRRGPGLLGDPAAPGVGGLRARRGVHRPPDRVPALPQALPGRPPRGGVPGPQGPRPRGRPGGDRLPELRHPRGVDGAARLQHDAQDPPRAGRGRGRAALPAPRDRPGHLRQLRQRHGQRPQEAAVRHRPDRQELPQRDHPGQLHLPHPRVRADGDGVLRRPGHRRPVAPVLDRRADPLVHRPRHRRGEPAPLRAPGREALALLHPHRRHRVPVRLHRLGVGRAGGRRQPHRLRPDDALAALRGRPELLRPGHRRALDPVRDRARRRADALADGLPRGGVRRGRGAEHQGRGRHPGGAAAGPPARAGQGRRAAALALGRPGAGGPRPGGAAAAHLERRRRRRGGHRAPVPAPGRDRHPVLPHGRLREPRGPCRDRARARHDGPDPGGDGPGGGLPREPPAGLL
ncbi:MAG: Glycyl-tRNA synthetase, partial [uncultured Quadrisphaera sp.]